MRRTNRIHIANELRMTGKDFSQLSKELAIKKATSEVYCIDCLAARMELDHKVIARHLDVTPEAFHRIKATILSNEDNKL